MKERVNLGSWSRQSHSQSEAHLGSSRQGLQISTGGSLVLTNGSPPASWTETTLENGKVITYDVNGGTWECSCLPHQSLVVNMQMSNAVLLFHPAADPSLSLSIQWRVFDVRGYS